MIARPRRIDQLVGTLAPLKDRELRGAAETPDAQALLSEILSTPFDETRPRRAPRRLFAGATAAAAVAAIVAGVLVSAGSRETESAAAAVLHRAAKVARAQENHPLQPGEYAYTKSVNAYLNTSVEGNGTSYSVLVPHIREVWLGPSGGRLYETSGTPSFLSTRDRETWIALGRPKLTAEGPTDTPLSIPRPVNLPTDPDALYARLKHDAKGHGGSLYGEMFVLVGDNLRESTLTPAQRAALYEVAARIPGVELVGRVRDSAGRWGVGVAMRNDANTGRQTLIFDQETSTLLAEEDVALAGNRTGVPPVSYPPGTTVGYSTYLRTGIVKSLHAKP